MINKSSNVETEAVSGFSVLHATPLILTAVCEATLKAENTNLHMS